MPAHARHTRRRAARRSSDPRRSLLAALALLAAITTTAVLLAPGTADARPLVNPIMVPGQEPTGNSSLPRRAPMYLNDLAIGNAFQIKFACDAVSVDFCQRAEKAFQRAAERFSKEIKFRRTITVDLALFLPCGTKNPAPDCAEINTLGFALPTQRIPVIHNDDGQTYLYPTALLKQLDLDGVPDRVTWPQYDILARFNSLRNWWFDDASNGGAGMTIAQRDLEMVATHELAHGLGWGDDMLMSLQFTPQDKMLMPYYDSTAAKPAPPATESAIAYNGAVFYGLSLPSIWNRFTFLSGKPVLSYVAPLNATVSKLLSQGAIASSTGPSSSSSAGAKPKAEPAQSDVQAHLLSSGNAGASNAVASTTPAAATGYSPGAVYAALKKDAAASDTLKQLYTLGTTAGALEFRAGVFPPGTTLTTTMTLESSLTPYADGSSLAHSAIPGSTPGNVAPEDFLMMYRASGKSFKDSIASGKAPVSGIGKATRDVLVALGYTPVADASFKSLKAHAKVDPSVLGASKPGSTASAAGDSNLLSGNGSKKKNAGEMVRAPAVAVAVGAAVVPMVLAAVL
ncbi:hypothetical protein GGF32_002944 [Allomyces javanicus]|nr:hypothetical protein GGF32_002944 [Allomyces javanicus]